MKAVHSPCLTVECLRGRERSLGSHRHAVGRCCAPDSTLNRNSRRFRRAIPGTPGGQVLDKDRTEQRGRGSRALFESARSNYQGDEAENGRARPGSIQFRPSRESGKEHRQHHGGRRRSGPYTKSDQLSAQPVFFNGCSQTCRTEQVAPNLEVPAVEITAAGDTETLCSQHRLDRLKPVAWSPPLLGPDGERARPGERGTRVSAP